MTFGARPPLSGEKPASLNAERLDSLLRRLPITVGASLLNSVLMAAVFWPIASKAGLLVWIGLQLLLAGCRLAGAAVYCRRGSMRSSTRQVERFVFCGAALSGAIWGAGAYLFPPRLPTYELFAAFIIGGMCAGNITTNSTHLPSAISFTVLASAPLAARLIVAGTPPQLAMAGLTLIFCACLSFIAWQASRQFREAYDLRQALFERNTQLHRANKFLEAEVQSHVATESALRDAKKMEAVGQITAGLAHDFNNILMVISVIAEGLSSETASPAVKKKLRMIIDGVDKGKSITTRMLAFARKQPLYPQTVDLNGLICAIEPLLSATLGAAVRLELPRSAGIWPVCIDPDQLERALINLAANARDAMPSGGIFRIATENVRQAGTAARFRDQSDVVAITVTDSGAGMSPEVLARAVNPFFTTKPVGKGTGLGLSQVHGLAAQSGGKIEITSEVGLGTSVRIVLPRSNPKPNADGLACAGAAAARARMGSG
jgi:signal transduction histidine kinase